MFPNKRIKTKFIARFLLIKEKKVRCGPVVDLDCFNALEVV
jgi:hypothetical protein